MWRACVRSTDQRVEPTRTSAEACWTLGPTGSSAPNYRCVSYPLRVDYRFQHALMLLGRMAWVASIASIQEKTGLHRKDAEFLRSFAASHNYRLQVDENALDFCGCC